MSLPGTSRTDLGVLQVLDVNPYLATLVGWPPWLLLMTDSGLCLWWFTHIESTHIELNMVYLEYYHTILPDLPR